MNELGTCDWSDEPHEIEDVCPDWKPLVKEIEVMFKEGDKVTFKGNPESPVFTVVYTNTGRGIYDLEHADAGPVVEYVPGFLLEKAPEPFKGVPGRFYEDKENDLWVGREDGKLVHLPDTYHLNEPADGDEEEYGPFTECTEFNSN